MIKNSTELKGNTFEFVGSMTGGGTKHEGHPGWRIDQILNISSNWSALEPDIIFMHLGSNDVMQGPYAYYPFPKPETPQMHCEGFDFKHPGYRNASIPYPWKCDISTLVVRMDKLLADTFSKLPNVHIFLSTIVGLPRINNCYYWPDGEINEQGLGLEFNSFLPGLVAKYQAQSKKITLVDMLNQSGVGKNSSNTCPCHVHPDDHGYYLMGRVFYESLVKNL
jgi:hypothetical protein